MAIWTLCTDACSPLWCHIQGWSRGHMSELLPSLSAEVRMQLSLMWWIIHDLSPIHHELVRDYGLLCFFSKSASESTVEPPNIRYWISAKQYLKFITGLSPPPPPPEVSLSLLISLFSKCYGNLFHVWVHLWAAYETLSKRFLGVREKAVCCTYWVFPFSMYTWVIHLQIQSCYCAPVGVV